MLNNRVMLKNPGETDEECMKRHGHTVNEGGLCFLVIEPNGAVRRSYRPIQPEPGMPRIVGDGCVAFAPAFYDVRDARSF